MIGSFTQIVNTLSDLVGSEILLQLLKQKIDEINEYIDVNTQEKIEMKKQLIEILSPQIKELSDQLETIKPMLINVDDIFDTSSKSINHVISSKSLIEQLFELTKDQQVTIDNLRDFFRRTLQKLISVVNESVKVAEISKNQLWFSFVQNIAIAGLPLLLF